MSLTDKYNIEDPNMRELIKELEGMFADKSNIQYSDKPLSPNRINEINADEIRVKDNKIYFRSGNELYSITGTKES